MIRCIASLWRQLLERKSQSIFPSFLPCKKSRWPLLRSWEYRNTTASSACMRRTCTVHIPFQRMLVWVIFSPNREFKKSQTLHTFSSPSATTIIWLSSEMPAKYRITQYLRVWSSNRLSTTSMEDGIWRQTRTSMHLQHWSFNPVFKILSEILAFYSRWIRLFNVDL